MRMQSAGPVAAFLIFAAILATAWVRGGVEGASAAPQPQAAATQAKTPPSNQKIRVAFVLTEGATMIDFAGPWEVFQDAGGEDGPDVFELFTVSESRNPIRTSGGMTVVPDYTFDDAPPAKIVVIGAQRGAPKLADWLRRVDKESEVIMSVCVGSFQLGKAGLLDGKQATTHHGYYDQFQRAFPKATLIKGRRFVQSDEVIYTAGGLTSGIDLALHIVEKYCGRDVAQKTANYMEYESKSWMAPQ
jgi:transcriptional regulator GlxA family with amidase domain